MQTIEGVKNNHIVKILKGSSDIKFIVIGGMHGNEHSGLMAFEKIIPTLKKVYHPEKGSIYFLKGNIKALQKNERFIDKDLNRLWLKKYINNEDDTNVEIKQLKNLNALITNDICQNKFDNCFFLDLHTFSAKSGVFCIPASNAKSEAFALSFGTPFIEKLAETLPGTALSYFGNKGMTSVVFEGGTHNTPEATQNLIAALWHSFAYAGLVDDNLPQVIQSRQHIQKISYQYPHQLELIYHHKLKDWHHFKMNRGYYNFKPIEKSENLAYQDNKKILSPSQGYILMPLYQKKGSDGFFIVKEKKPE